MFSVVDTAGIRNTKDEVEKIGIERSYDVIKNSDLIVFITDNPKRDSEDLKKLYEMISKEKIIKVINKSDIIKADILKNYSDFIAVNTVSEGGLQNLKKAILNRINIDSQIIKSGILTNTRQISALKKALVSIKKAITAVEHDYGFEFIAFDLKEASSFIEEILGKVTSEDILNSIFSNFCIGK